ncbi:MAG: hypothetical protein NXH70_07775 [Hyphomonas sp.]|nr:hypothetical protein [Hyphomonas sp.]
MTIQISPTRKHAPLICAPANSKAFFANIAAQNRAFHHRPEASIDDHHQQIAERDPPKVHDQGIAHCVLDLTLRCALRHHGKHFGIGGKKRLQREETDDGQKDDPNCVRGEISWQKSWWPVGPRKVECCIVETEWSGHFLPP